MKGWLAKALRRLREGYRIRRRLSQGNFRDMVQDVRFMADISGRLWIRDEDFQERVRKIQAEMDRLEEMVAKHSFASLSLDKKQKLHQGLQRSRQELLKSIRSAPCPTDRIQ